MFKKAKLSILAMVALVSGITYSCSQQDDPISELKTKTSHNETSDLVKAMAADETVNAFFKDWANLVMGYKDALHSMSSEEREKYYDQDDYRTEHNVSPDYLIMSDDEAKRYNQTQLERVEKISKTFPEYANMGDEQKNEVISQVLAQVYGEEVAKFPGCANNYLYCLTIATWEGGGDACWAAFKSCMNVMYPSPRK